MAVSDARNDEQSIVTWVGADAATGDQQQADAALTDGEDRFRLLFANHPTPLWVYDLATLAFLEVNEAAREHYGYSREEFLAMRITDIRTAADEVRLREDLERSRPSLQYSGDWRHRRKDGAIIEVEITSHTLRYAGRDAVLVSARDVSAQRRAERRTREALNAVLGVAEAVVAVHDPPSGAQTASARSDTVARLAQLVRQFFACRHVSIIGIEPESERVLPVACAGFTPEEERQWWLRGEAHLLLTEHLTPESIAALRSGEMLLLDRSQPPFDQHTTFGRHIVMHVPLHMGHGLGGVLSIDYAEDAGSFSAEELEVLKAMGRLVSLVVERERLLREQAAAQAKELALLEANRRMDEFLGIAGHEMRTPLTTIMGTIELVNRRLVQITDQSDQQFETVLERLRSTLPLLRRTDVQLLRLNRLVDDLLDVARLGGGILPVVPTSTDLAVIVRETVEEQRQVGRGRELILEMPAAATVPIAGDAQRLAQVLNNYLSNAFRYAPPDQPITVGLDLVETPTPRARVWVRDQGPGLPPEEQERIWARFYRVEGIGHRTGSSIGLGLGLYLSRMIIDQHGGETGLHSAPGEGATFWFTIPRGDGTIGL